MKFTEKSRLPGPNRRCDASILEYQLWFDLEPATGNDVSLQRAMQNTLQEAGCNSLTFAGTSPLIANSRTALLAQRLAELAILLQQDAGHAVAMYGVQADSEDPAALLWFEYDHPEVGERAAVIALAIMRLAVGLDRDEDAEFAREGSWREFLEFAQGKALPMETRALAAAAARRGIPCFKLDRYPYDPLEGAFRVRPGGLLRLGHARFQYVLDGTLCVNRNTRQVKQLAERRGLRTALMACGIQFDASASGSRQHILVIGGQAVSVLQDGVQVDSSAMTPAAREQIASVHRRYDLPIYAATIAANGSWSGMELAPRLENWFPDGGPSLDEAADCLLGQYYPPGVQYRIPIVSVTGTNGKTTTCTMLRRIMIQAGRVPVTVCSNGVFVGNQHQGTRRDIGPAATYYALETAAADVAVLEDYFGSINRFGFAYDWSDVGVCTNVTADHLHRLGVHTLEEMAEVKFAVIARARKGAVLNADDPWCAGMLSRSTAEKRVAVSLIQGYSKLAAAHAGLEHFCVLEEDEGEQVITLYDKGQRIPLIAVNDIPATRNGMAKHNTSNAMHSAAAAWVLGISPVAIAGALRAFASDFETCPGRLNEFTGLPFRVIMDYAHNRDGFRQVSAFVDAQQVTGRKFVLFSFSEDRRGSDIREAVRELAGHFDRYTCGKFREPRNIVTEDIPGTLQAALLESGVEAEAVSVAGNSREALDLILAQARPGDLLVLLVDGTEFGIVWQKLMSVRDDLVHHQDQYASHREKRNEAQVAEHSG